VTGKKKKGANNVLCAEAGIPSPDFEERAGQFVTTIWREWLTEEVMAGLGLSDRQQIAVNYLKVHGRITNKEYKELTGVTDRTVLREFKELLAKGVLEKVGETGRGTHYMLRRKTRQTRRNASGCGTRHKPDKRDMTTSIVKEELRVTGKQCFNISAAGFCPC
jgi:ribosomal protein L44E